MLYIVGLVILKIVVMFEDKVKFFSFIFFVRKKIVKVVLFCVIMVGNNIGIIVLLFCVKFNIIIGIKF